VMSDKESSCPMSMKNQLPSPCCLRCLRALLARLESQSGQAYGGPAGMRHQRQGNTCRLSNERCQSRSLLLVAHFSIEKWHIFHFDVFFSHGSQGDFFDYKLVNIWLDKITQAQGLIDLQQVLAPVSVSPPSFL